MENVFQDREALHNAIYNCTRCQERGYPVERVQPKWDPSKAQGAAQRWGMLVGQAPGIHELERATRQAQGGGPRTHSAPAKRTGIAFQGPAGQRLRQWLREAGFTDRQVCTQFTKTSVTKCFPGRNKDHRDRTPTKEEIALCAPFLKAQIQLVNPTVLTPLGKVAINWFFPEVKRLEAVIGQVRRWQQGGTAYSVVCLPHPSPASSWWKARKNQPLLERAIHRLGQLRISEAGLTDA